MLNGLMKGNDSFRMWDFVETIEEVDTTSPEIVRLCLLNNRRIWLNKLYKLRVTKLRFVHCNFVSRSFMYHD